MDIKETNRDAFANMRQAIDDQAERSLTIMRELRDSLVDEIRVKSATLASLAAGPGALVDRASHIFATEFKFGAAVVDRGFDDGQRISCEGMTLLFQGASYQARLVSDRHMSRNTAPTIKSGQLYRALVLLEPID